MFRPEKLPAIYKFPINYVWRGAGVVWPLGEAAEIGALVLISRDEPRF